MIVNVHVNVGFTIEARDHDAAHERIVDLLSAVDDPSFLLDPDIMEVECY